MDWVIVGVGAPLIVLALADLLSTTLSVASVDGVVSGRIWETPEQLLERTFDGTGFTVRSSRDTIAELLRLLEHAFVRPADGWSWDEVVSAPAERAHELGWRTKR